jgi:hypothetical protein
VADAGWTDRWEASGEEWCLCLYTDRAASRFMVPSIALCLILLKGFTYLLYAGGLLVTADLTRL